MAGASWLVSNPHVQTSIARRRIEDLHAYRSPRRRNKVAAVPMGCALSAPGYLDPNDIPSARSEYNDVWPVDCMRRLVLFSDIPILGNGGADGRKTTGPM